MGELTGGIAHDFNNLIAEISGSLGLIRRRVDAGRVGKIEPFIKGALKAANSAGVLTHRLLAFARRQSLDIKSTDVNSLVDGMFDMLRRTLGKNIALEWMPSVDLWPALTDANQLDSVVLNLVINARDAMPDGGRLTVETTNLAKAETRRSGSFQVGDYVVIAVSDTGSGMPSDVIAHAVDPFFTTKPVGQGTGLGLSMVYGFVKQSGGHVRIDSKVGEGTSVKMYLPRAVQVAELPVDRIKLDALSGNGQTVLVVDDNDTLRAVMIEVVKELGYRYLEAADAHAAIPMLQSSQPINLLLTDVGLPITNGRQLAEMGRLLRPDLKVLFVTGYAANAAMHGEFLAPDMEMLHKPFTVEALGEKLEALLKR